MIEWLLLVVGCLLAGFVVANLMIMWKEDSDRDADCLEKHRKTVLSKEVEEQRQAALDGLKPYLTKRSKQVDDEIMAALEEWTCRCGYMNDTPICTHCFGPRVVPVETNNLPDLTGSPFWPGYRRDDR